MRRTLSFPARICGAVAVVLVPLLLVAGSVAAPRSAEALAPTLRAEMRQLVAAGVPGVVVLVRRDGTTVRLASGSARLKPQTPMRVENRFRVGSITKSFVATVALQLVGEGKLSLDDTVERWLPGLVPHGDTITVRHLLSHRSGLYDYLEDPQVLKPYLNGNFGYEWTPRRLVAISAAHAPLFSPGAKYAYSNTNYILAGLIVEAAAGAPVGDELNRRIFAPLGLRSTSFDTTPRSAEPFAHGYLVQGKQLQDVSFVSPSYAWAAGAIVSTADDLARFYQALLGGRLLPAELLQAMETTQDNYGLGLARAEVPPSWGSCGGTLLGHDGALAAYDSFAFSSVDAGRQAVVLANSLTFDDKVGNKQAQAALTRLFRTALCG